MSEEKEQEEKDTELDLIAEQELLRLTRQFRVSYVMSYAIFACSMPQQHSIDQNAQFFIWKVLEGDKEAYLEEASKALKRQRKVIYDLENWKLQYVRSLTVYRSRDNTRKDNEYTSGTHVQVIAQRVVVLVRS